MLRRPQTLFLLIFTFFKVSAFANTFYLSPTPRGFNSNERFNTTYPQRFDSEVESDELAFLRVPCQFQYVMRMNPNFFCGSVGSIGSKRFLSDIDLAFAHSFTNNTTVRYQGVKKQDFSTDTESGRVEIIHQFKEGHHFGLHGALDSEKANNDAGASYNFSSSEFLARIEFNAFDFDRNKRNEDLDFFYQKPISIGASFLKVLGSDRYYLNLHLEPQFIWQSEQEQVKRLRHWAEGFVLNEYGYFAFEHRQALTHVGETYVDEKYLRLHGEKRFERWLTGSRVVRKSWRQNEGQTIQYDVVPFLWYRFENYPKWDTGYDLTFHQEQGDKLKFEHRWNVAWNIFENSSGFFRLLFTFDLDRFGTEETWEGGSGQLAFTF